MLLRSIDERRARGNFLEALLLWRGGGRRQQRCTHVLSCLISFGISGSEAVESSRLPHRSGEFPEFSKIRMENGEKMVLFFPADVFPAEVFDWTPSLSLSDN